MINLRSEAADAAEVRNIASATIDAFVAEHADADLVWTAVPVVRTQYVLHRLGGLAQMDGSRRMRIAAWRLAKLSRALLRRNASESYLLVSGVLFAFATENQRRSLAPVFAVASGKARPEFPLDIRPSAVGLRRLATIATKHARELSELLSQAGVGHPGGEIAIHRAFQNSARCIAVAQATIDRRAPTAVVVATNHSPQARALARVSRLAGVPSVFLPHAPMLMDIGLRDLPFDYAALRGACEAGWYAAGGTDKSQLGVVGNPALSPSPILAAIPNDAPVVLATSPDHRFVIQEMIGAIASKTTRPVVLAPHPRQTERSLGTALPPGWSCWRGRTYDLLRSGVATLVQYSSGVALEGMLLGVPVIELDLLGDGPSYPFLKSKLVSAVRSTQDLPKALEASALRCDDSAYREQLVTVARGWCDAAGAEAAERAWRFIGHARAEGVHSVPVLDTWGRANVPGTY
ncbi:MAG TPA: hypothetical protein VH853_19995 [Polyangia bacterium]|nr:hypothetical protein [Polyangia bacterium]